MINAKRIITITLIGFFIIFIGLTISCYAKSEEGTSATNPKVESSEKQEAIRTIDGYRKEAKFHIGAIKEIANQVSKAKYNIPVITHTAYLASKFGYHTIPLVNIAKMASSCDHECPELSNVADLVVMKLSETSKVMQLAELSVKAQSDEEKSQVKQKIEEIKTTADYKSIDEALDKELKRQNEIFKKPKNPDSIFNQKVESKEKREALRTIKEYYKKANSGAILEIASMVPTAKHNIPVIVHIAYLAQSFGYHTKPLIDIVKIASASDQECPELSEIADLVVMKLSDTGKDVQLAELAVKAQSDGEKKQIKQKIEEIKATTDYKSIEEALKGQKQRDK